MKLVYKERKKSTLAIIGEHFEKYRISMFVATIFLSLFALFYIIYWNFDENSGGELVDNLYLASHITFLVVSQAMLIFLILNKFKKMSNVALAVFTHAVCFFLIAWATFVCILDLRMGISPLIYLLAATVISGLFVLEPFFYAGCMLASIIALLIFHIFDHFSFFSNAFQIENIVETLIFIAATILICFRRFNVIIAEHKTKRKLEELTYYDELTGLLNERSYINLTEELNKAIKEDREEDFAVILMDVNNLKATNDAYGHRYGCSLVVRCGAKLPELFKSSKLFHIGGDEFVAIVMGEDFANFDAVYERFLDAVTYKKVKYEGVELIFSVASGYAIHEKGEKYQNTLQKADKMMYENKTKIKAKYNMKGR